MASNRPAKHPALPTELKYLQRFASSLAKLAPDELNEDVDATELDLALKKRVRDLNEAEAEAVLAKDSSTLKKWLKDKPTHPAHWILGCLLLPGLSSKLLENNEEQAPIFHIHFDAPEKWKMTVVPYSLHLKKGKLIGVITKFPDEDSFRISKMQQEQWKSRPGIDATQAITPIKLNNVSGTKCSFRQFSPITWKRVEYLLEVPGGYVSAMLDAMGADFDETLFEAKLDSISIIQAP